VATPFQANEGVLRAVGDALNGKILIDCTNPVGPGLTHGLGNVQSGSEMVQALAPGATPHLVWAALRR
jgi:predicted dinucleotide-binding enzyme